MSKVIKMEDVRAEILSLLESCKLEAITKAYHSDVESVKTGLNLALEWLNSSMKVYDDDHTCNCSCKNEPKEDGLRFIAKVNDECDDLWIDVEVGIDCTPQDIPSNIEYIRAEMYIVQMSGIIYYRELAFNRFSNSACTKVSVFKRDLEKIIVYFTKKEVSPLDEVIIAKRVLEV